MADFQLEYFPNLAAAVSSHMTLNKSTTEKSEEKREEKQINEPKRQTKDNVTQGAEYSTVVKRYTPEKG